MGLLASTITKKPDCFNVLVMIGTLIPVMQFAGIINPVSSLDGLDAGLGKFIRQRIWSISVVEFLIKVWALMI